MFLGSSCSLVRHVKYEHVTKYKHKGHKKLSPMGLLTRYNTHQVDPSTIINDWIDGEVLVPPMSTRPEHYFCISADEMR